MQQHIGIDVSKDYLDICSYPAGSVQRVRNRASAIDRLVERWRDHETPIIMEATGGYERLVFTRLRGADIPACVVNARHIRHFARATGRLAKTDRLDAAAIAHYAAVIGAPMQQTVPDYPLKDLVARRRQLVDLTVQEKNRMEKAETPFLRRQIEEHLAFLKRQVQDSDQAIAAHIAQRQDQAERLAILTSVPGIGDTTAAILLADLPELGSLTDRQVAALAGLAPMNQDSGQMRGTRHIQGGRISVRCALYMAAVASLRCNPNIKAFYTRLRANGKPPKVAITAAMRKLLILLNTLLKNNRMWKNTLDT